MQWHCLIAETGHARDTADTSILCPVYSFQPAALFLEPPGALHGDFYLVLKIARLLK